MNVCLCVCVGVSVHVCPGTHRVQRSQDLQQLELQAVMKSPDVDGGNQTLVFSKSNKYFLTAEPLDLPFKL